MNIVSIYSPEEKARVRNLGMNHDCRSDELKYPKELVEQARACFSCHPETWRALSRSGKYELVCDYLLQLVLVLQQKKGR
jgi:hypothetical protein